MSVAKLLSIAGPALCTNAACLPAEGSWTTGIFSQLFGMLRERNGFFAFEAALHVFPIGDSAESFDVLRWNSPGLWRFEYQSLTDGCFFFAEDVFGGQFCIADGEVHTFDPETAVKESIADSIEGWAAELLARYRVLTGHPLAREWQARNGAIPAFKRLVPKQPFVCGGEFEVENLYAADAVEAMRFRGHLASEIKDLPDGAAIRWKVVP